MTSQRFNTVAKTVHASFVKVHHAMELGLDSVAPSAATCHEGVQGSKGKGEREEKQ